MSEIIDDKVDKFHESLLKRYSRKTLIVVIIFVALFSSWYDYTTYKEYDFWTGVGNIYENWQLIREIEIVNGNVTKIKYFDDNEYGISFDARRQYNRDDIHN